MMMKKKKGKSINMKAMVTNTFMEKLVIMITVTSMNLKIIVRSQTLT
jgi:hypothetical protein